MGYAVHICRLLSRNVRRKNMRVDKTVENVRSCLCWKCPSYSSRCKLKNGQEIPFDVSHLQHLEVMFCAFEKSNCIRENQGCLCAKCMVHKKYALNNEDYCLNTGGVF